ncbi:MAG: hypothetical protein K2G70_06605 [Turicibacter sp.]|nr:hypothetical protein [Turicibacter sp.]
MRVCDICLENTPTAILKGKGSKIHIVPLMPETIKPFPELYEAVPSRRADAFTSALLYVKQ